MHVKEWCTKPCTVATIGLILVGFGTLFMIFWPEIFDQQLANQLKLSPESKTYGPWKSPPIPMTLDIYLFNWTNSEDFLNSSTRPILQQLGPYVFTEKPDKVNITWHPENSTVTYMKKSRFYFDPVKSKGSLDDVITSLNVVPLAAAETTRYKSYMEQAKVNIGLQVYDQQLVVTKTANEFLFEGYEDDLVNAATQLSFLSDGQTVPFDRVGWFYMRNDTANLTGVYNVHTGESDIHQLGRLMNWNYADRTDFFAGECGMVNGSAGELFPPNVEKTNRMSLFTPDLCRSLPLDFEKEEMVHGLKGFKFSGGEKTVDNGTKYPENLCFNPGQEGIPSGVMNISACRFGTPVFMSFPHFYAADPFYVNQVGGMQPDEEKHKFFMTFEPKLGVALDVAARLQMNLLIRPHENIALFKNVPEVYFPILWFEQRVTMPPSLAEEMAAVYMVPKIGYGILGIIIFFGLVLICWFPVATLCGKRFDRTEKAPKQKTISTVEISETERPLMFQDQGRTKRSIEMEPVTKQYNFDSREASTADERFS